MQALRDRPRPFGNICVASEKRNFGPASGWEENLTDHKNLGQKIIEAANAKIALDSLFQKYNVTLEASYSTTGWAFRGSCPFPDHNDRKPSFGFNPDVGIFNCFGCHRGGKAVEFIANMDGRRHIDVAREIIGNYSDDEVLIHNSKFDFERLRVLLFAYADTIRAFKKQYSNEEAAKYAKAVTWNLDVYLRKNAPSHTIVLDNLEARIVKLKSQLMAYGESN